MINLLPPKEKENLLLEKTEKLFFILGILVLFFLVCLSLVFLFLKYYFLGNLDSYKMKLDAAEEKYNNSSIAHLSEIIKTYNLKIKEVNNLYDNKIYFSDIFKTIAEIKMPEGLYFKRILMGDAKVTISGVSVSRDNLLIFKENLENNDRITDIYFTPNSWIKSENAEFYLTFAIKT